MFYKSFSGDMYGTEENTTLINTFMGFSLS